MKKFYSFMLAAAVFSVASCQKEMTNDLINNEAGYKFSATISNDTKTVLQDGVKTLWAEGDNITVFDAEKKAVTFIGQQTEASATADFYAESFNPAEKAYAVYPESTKDAEFDGQTISGLYISAQQTAVAGGFDPRYTVAVGEETETGKLTFKNAHSLVKFTIAGEKAPESITFTNGGDKPIAGSVSYDVEEKKAQVAAEGASLSIVLAPAAGESFEVGKTYYIAFCADGDMEDMTLSFDETVVKEVAGVKENVSNGKIFNLGEVGIAEKEAVEVTATYLKGEYYSNDYSVGYNYYLLLSDKGYTDDYEFYPDSKFFVIDIYSDIPVDGSYVVPHGVYTFDPDGTCEAGTIGGDYSYMLTIDDDYLQAESYFVNGKMTVTDNHIDLMIETEDGTLYHVTYEGSLEFASGSDSYISNLDDDLEIVSENGYFFAECYGDYYEVGKNNYMISIYENSETFSGSSVMFEILTDNANGITGKYIAFNAEEEEIYDCFLPGGYEVEEGYLYPYCSWYLSVTEGSMDGEGYAPLVDGEITITEDGGVYTFSFDCYDDAGHNISGNIKATGEVYDENGEIVAYTRSGSTDVKKGKREGWSVKLENRFVKSKAKRF